LLFVISRQPICHDLLSLLWQKSEEADEKI
jgi:hypothetical protein